MKNKLLAVLLMSLLSMPVYAQSIQPQAQSQACKPTDVDCLKAERGKQEQEKKEPKKIEVYDPTSNDRFLQLQQRRQANVRPRFGG